MNIVPKRFKSWSAVAGVVGLAALACTSCCLPLIAAVTASIGGPLAAWFGVGALGVGGNYQVVAAGVGGVFAIFALIQWRSSVTKKCACNTACAPGQCE